MTFTQRGLVYLISGGSTQGSGVQGKAQSMGNRHWRGGGFNVWWYTGEEGSSMYGGTQGRGESSMHV